MSLKDRDYQAWLAELRTELDTGHPTTGAYNADDQTAANELNAENRPITQAISRAELWKEFQDQASGVLSTVVDAARDEVVEETDESPQAPVDRRTKIERTRLHPSTAEFIGLFQSFAAVNGAPLNFRTDPYDAMLEQMVTAESTLNAGAANAIRALCDLTASRATEVWGTRSVSSVTTTTATEYVETVRVAGIDVQRARAL